MANLLVPTTYADIATAIGAANNGDSVDLEEGLFQGANNRDQDSGGLDPITFRGLGSDPSDVVIDCQTAGRAFSWSTNENNITLENFTIINGLPNNVGGAIEMTSVEVTANHLVIHDCQGRDWGGAIFAGYANNRLTMFNCLLYDNTVTLNTRSGGGAVSVYNAPNCTFDSCTLADNTAAGAGSQGGAVHLEGNAARAALTDCVVWGNTAVSGKQLYRNNGHTSAGAVDYCDYSNGVGDVAGTWTITNSITTDPLFATGGHGDYYLSQIAAGQGADSGAVDTGSDTAANLGLETFTTRTDNVFDEGTADMGYHYSDAVPLSGAELLQMTP